MSNRTLIELNHDYCPSFGRGQDKASGDAALLEWARRMQHYVASGDKSHLPDGVTWKHMRHHSESCPLATISKRQSELDALKSAPLPEEIAEIEKRHALCVAEGYGEEARHHTIGLQAHHDRATLLAYIKSAPPALPTPQWQPIETAPRDGTPVLGFYPDAYQGKGGAFVILWLKDQFVTVPGSYRNMQFTQWRPIDFPQQRSKEGSPTQSLYVEGYFSDRIKAGELPPGFGDKEGSPT